jgi:hypothetical protein
VRITKKAVAGVAAVALAGGGGVLAMTSADAAETPEPGPRALAAGSTLGEGSIQGWHLKDGTIFAADMNPAVVKWFTAGPYNNTVTGPTVKDGSLDRADLNAKTTNELDNGKGVGTKDFAAKAITTIGGSFATGKTVVGTVEVAAAGTYLVNTSAVFDRKDEASDGYLAPTTDTYPSLVVRYGDDYTPPVKWGVDAGTIMGSPVSRKGFVELTGSATKTITVDGPTTLNVYGFGYNEDRSGFGGGQITVSAQVTVVKIG